MKYNNINGIRPFVYLVPHFSVVAGIFCIHNEITTHLSMKPFIHGLWTGCYFVNVFVNKAASRSFYIDQKQNVYMWCVLGLA